MFTGIVQEVGRISRVRGADKGLTLSIEAPKTAQNATVGDSICTSGVCLTCTRVSDDRFDVDVSAETLRRTTLGARRVGDRVNLEPALRLADRIGGHLVTGHVDATGRVTAIRPEGTGKVIGFEAPEAVLRYVIEKGSIAVDGVSLTVASLTARGFEVALIPHTLAVTTLGSLLPNTLVNLEADMIGKYVERLLGANRDKAADMWETLGRTGFTGPSGQTSEGVQ